MPFDASRDMRHLTEKPCSASPKMRSGFGSRGRQLAVSHTLRERCCNSILAISPVLETDSDLRR
jgi:hypothetical protein